LASLLASQLSSQLAHSLLNSWLHGLDAQLQIAAELDAPQMTALQRWLHCKAGCTTRLAA